MWGYVMSFKHHSYDCDVPSDFFDYQRFREPASSGFLLTNAIIPVSVVEGGSQVPHLALVEAYPGAHSNEDCPWVDSAETNWHVMVESLESTRGSNCLDMAKSLLYPHSSTQTGTSYEVSTTGSEAQPQPLVFVLWLQACNEFISGIFSTQTLAMRPIRLLDVPVNFSDPPENWPDEVTASMCAVVDPLESGKLPQAAKISTWPGVHLFDGVFLLKKRRFTALLSACFKRGGGQYVELENCSSQYLSR
jgi:hypothetical protein